jgi:hypothetical protein
MIFLGGYFYQFEQISLKASENGKQLTSGRGATVTEAVYQYEYMVSCDIPASRKRSFPFSEAFNDICLNW